MPIDLLRLSNCKGFKDVNLELKPLTLLLGPNSSGKSSLCKMLVALSKIHKRGGEPNLQFEDIDSLDLGSYSELVYSKDYDSKIVIGIGVPTGYIEFGFGGLESPSVPPRALTYIKISGRENIAPAHKKAFQGEIVDLKVPENANFDNLKMLFDLDSGDKYVRNSQDNWSGPIGQPYDLSFAGLRLKNLITVSSNSITFNADYPRTPFNEISTVLSRLVYLRPDREMPRRVYYRHCEDGKTAIGDRGEGTAWYLHENWHNPVRSYRYPPPTFEIAKAKEQISELSKMAQKGSSLGEELIFWLDRLGLVSHIETSLPLDSNVSLPEGVKANLGVTLRARVKPGAPIKDLPDLGFGVSQALPVLVAGLMVPEAGLLIVDQPEAELHPRPQSELADFFCSMVKCGKSVLIETHSEAIFHRLRLRAEQDEDLASKIAIYFIDEPGEDKEGDFSCKNPKPIQLDENSEFSWPIGFLSDGFAAEQHIRAARVAKERKEISQ